MSKKEKTFTCKDCGGEFRSKAYLPMNTDLKLCPQCYTQREMNKYDEQKVKEVVSKMIPEGNPGCVFRSLIFSLGNLNWQEVGKKLEYHCPELTGKLFKETK